MIYCDKYFTDARKIAEVAGLDRTQVTYRVFSRFRGIGALMPVKNLIECMTTDAEVLSINEYDSFDPEDTMMLITGPFGELVELETQILQWSALPCYTAFEFSKIWEHTPQDCVIIDGAARHLYSDVSVALSSYGASIANCDNFSTEIGANSLDYLSKMAFFYSQGRDEKFTSKPKQAVGTLPHSVIALFSGDYDALLTFYRKAFPGRKIIVPIDYNNREFTDAVSLIKKHDEIIQGFRLDTCGENHMQTGDGVFDSGRGVNVNAVREYRQNLNDIGYMDKELYLSSGFDAQKAKTFGWEIPDSFDGIVTGSFIPKGPQCTMDICRVNGKYECKVGRSWGYLKDHHLLESVKKDTEQQYQFDIEGT